MKKRSLILLLGAFGVVLALLAILLFYQRGREQRTVSSGRLQNPIFLVEQIEEEVDLLRQFQQERDEAAASVAERLLIENFIDVQKEKIKGLSGLAQLLLRREDATRQRSAPDDPLARLRRELQTREQAAQSLSGAAADAARAEIASLQQRIDAMELQLAPAPAPAGSGSLNAAEVSLIRDRLQSIERSRMETPAPAATGKSETGGMWGDFVRLFQVFGRTGRVRGYHDDLTGQSVAVRAFLASLQQSHQSLVSRVAGAVANVTAADMQQHRQLQEQIEGLSRVNASLDEQASLLARWQEVLRKDRIDVGFQLLVRLLVLTLAILAICLIAFLVRELPERLVRDEKSRYYSRKIISFLTGFAIFVSVVFALMGQFSYVGPMIGLVGAGLAIALQDVIVSAVGWFFIIGRLGISIGDRVEIDGVKGDVIDIGVFRTVILEVGNWIRGDQATGRVVFFPNSFVFRNHFFNYQVGTNYIWDELEVGLTYQSNWRKAKEAFLQIAREVGASEIEEARREMRLMSRRFLLHEPRLDPMVYVKMRESGVALIVRYVTPVRSRRAVSDDINERILGFVEREPDLDLSFPTRRNLQETVPHVESPKEAWRKQMGAAEPSAAEPAQRKAVTRNPTADQS